MEILMLIVIVFYLTWRFIVNPDLAESVTVKQWIQFICVATAALFVAAFIVAFGRSIISDMENRSLFSFIALCLIVFASWIAFRIMTKYTPAVIQKVLGFYYEK